MLKLSLKILKRVQFKNIRYESSITNKDYFLNLAGHVEKIQESKEPTDHLKFVKDELQKNHDDYLDKIKESTQSKDNLKFIMDKAMEYSNGYVAEIHDSKHPEDFLKFSNDKLIENDKYYAEIIQKSKELRDNQKFIESYREPNVMLNHDNEFKDFSFDNENSNDAVNYIETGNKVLNETKIVDNSAIADLKNKIDDIRLDDLNTLQSDTENIKIASNEFSTLQNLMKLGVDLDQVNKRDPSNKLICLNWETDIMPLITYFKEQCGFTDKDLAKIFGVLPTLAQRSLQEINAIFDYLSSRKISNTDISSMMLKQPQICSFEARTIEKRLNKIENMVKLDTEQMNTMIILYPEIITGDLGNIKMRINYLAKGVGFTPDEMKDMVITSPNILLTHTSDLENNFVFLHRTLQLSYEQMAQCAPVFASMHSVVNKRVRYLLFLNRTQNNHTEVTDVHELSAMVQSTDQQFCDKWANTSLKKFRAFSKTL